MSFLGETAARSFECAQTQLAEALALDQHPVLVPVREQIGHERAWTDAAAGECGTRHLFCLPKVDVNVAADPKRPGIDVEEAGSESLDSPERRAEARRCPRLGPVEPERAGNVGSQQRALVERYERDHALCAHRHPHGPPVDVDAEAVEEPKRDLLRRSPAKPRRPGVEPQG